MFCILVVLGDADILFFVSKVHAKSLSTTLAIFILHKTKTKTTICQISYLANFTFMFRFVLLISIATLCLRLGIFVL